MRFLTLMLLLLWTSGAWSEQMFVRNKPFRGQMVGKLSSEDFAVELSPLVKALGFRITDVRGNRVVTRADQEPALPAGAHGAGKLYVNGHEVATTQDGAATLVPLRSFAEAADAVVLYNAETGTLDVNLARGAKSGTWGTGKDYRVVCFGSPKAPATRYLQDRTLTKFEKETGVPVIYVNVDEKTSENYKAYIYLFSGTFIPHTVLINRENRPVKRWTGAIELEKFSREVRGALR